MEYDDFVVHITPGQGRGYGVWVQSPKGSGKGRFEIPAGLGAAARGTLSSPGREIDEDGDRAGRKSPTAREVGDLLFQALFKDGVRDRFFESLGGIGGSGHGLRIRLLIRPDLGEVQALPWELLHRPDSDDYLGLSPKTPVVRSLEVPRPSLPSLVGDRLRILAVAPRPQGYETLDLNRECRNLKAAWRWRWNAKVKFLPNPGLEELHQALERGRFQVLHFMGHGTFAEGEGALLFQAPDGGASLVTGRDLATELKEHPSLRLVVLNACQSARMAEAEGLDPFAGVASALMLGGMPAVVAMQSRISDPAAIAFSKQFYLRLADGQPVDTAITEGRRAIRRQDGEEGGWGLPVLFLLAKEGTLFKDSVPSQGRSTLTKALAASLALLIAILILGFTFRKSYEALQLNNQGAELLQEGRLKEARDTLEAALRLDGGYAAAHANLASVEEQQGDYDAALRHAQAAVEKAPDAAVYQYNLGSLLVEMGRYEQSIPSLSRATELEPCHAAAFNELGHAYLELAEPVEARHAIEIGLRCDHTTGPLAKGPLLKNLGRAYLEEKRPGDAVEPLEQALYFYAHEHRRDFWEPTYLLAEAHAGSGQQEPACRRLRDFSHLAAAGATPWAPDAKRLAQQLGCGIVFE